MITAGILRQRVEIYQRTQTPTDDGGWTDTDELLDTVWASVEPLTGREFLEAAQMTDQVTHRVRMRYYAGLTPKHWLKLNGRTLGIVSVLNKDELNVDLEIMCKEAV